LQESRKHTLMSVRRTLTEPKTALAGAIGETFSARLVSWMAAFNAEVAPSRPPGGWESVVMVGTRNGCERTVRREGQEEDSYCKMMSAH